MKIVKLGGLTLSGNMTLTVVSGVSSQFTLTCISTGGPATTVTWTRDNVTITEGTETVLNDPVTAQYTHTIKSSFFTVVSEIFEAIPGQRQVNFMP